MSLDTFFCPIQTISAFFFYNQTPVVADLVLSITVLRLVNRDVMQLNIVTGQPQPESVYGYRTHLMSCSRTNKTKMEDSLRLHTVCCMTLKLCAFSERRVAYLSLLRYRTIFGRPFVKRFARCYGTVVCPLLYVLSVTLVYYGQTVGWIKMKLGTEVGLGPGNIVLDGDPASPPPKKKEGRAHSQISDPCLLWPNGWMDQDATWHEGRSQPRRLC